MAKLPAGLACAELLGCSSTLCAASVTFLMLLATLAVAAAATAVVSTAKTATQAL